MMGGVASTIDMFGVASTEAMQPIPMGGAVPQMQYPMQPGMIQPGMIQPGMIQPGMMQPGMQNGVGFMDAATQNAQLQQYLQQTGYTAPPGQQIIGYEVQWGMFGGAAPPQGGAQVFGGGAQFPPVGGGAQFPPQYPPQYPYPQPPQYPPQYPYPQGGAALRVWVLRRVLRRLRVWVLRRVLRRELGATTDRRELGATTKHLGATLRWCSTTEHAPLDFITNDLLSRGSGIARLLKVLLQLCVLRCSVHKTNTILHARLHHARLNHAGLNHARLNHARLHWILHLWHGASHWNGLHGFRGSYAKHIDGGSYASHH